MGLSPEMEEKVTQIQIAEDNFFKIGLIFLRIYSRLPIILMGETGIGKTSLLQLLADIMQKDFNTVNVHAGTTEEEIRKKVRDCSNRCRGGGS